MEARVKNELLQQKKNEYNNAIKYCYLVPEKSPTIKCEHDEDNFYIITWKVGCIKIFGSPGSYCFSERRPH